MTALLAVGAASAFVLMTVHELGGFRYLNKILRQRQKRKYRIIDGRLQRIRRY